MSIPNSEYVRAGIRYLKMSEEEKALAKAGTKAAVWEKVEAEAAAIAWVQLAALCWYEQGVLDDVFDHIKSVCGPQAKLDTAA